MWQSVSCESDAPATRCKHACCLLAGHVYLLAGRNGNLPLRDFWKFSLAEGVWQEIKAGGDVPPSLQEHSMVAWEDKLYVFGGEVGFYGGTETPLWCYHTKTNEWRKLSQPVSARGIKAFSSVPGGSKITALRSPRALRSHTALVHNGFMYVYGGYRDLKGSTGELWRYDFESGVWSELHPGPGPVGGRHLHSAVLQDGNMWIYGGMNDLIERVDLWKLDLTCLKWSQWRSRGATCPQPRHGHVAARVLSWMLVYGGLSRGHSSSEIWRFHFATENWERVTAREPQPQPRSQSAAVVVSAMLLPSLPAVESQRRAPTATTATSIPVVHADVLRRRVASATAKRVSIQPLPSEQPAPPAPQPTAIQAPSFCSSASRSSGARAHMASSHFLSRIAQVNMSIRQPSYSALSNGSAESVEMQQMQLVTPPTSGYSARTDGQLPKSFSSYMMPPVEGGRVMRGSAETDYGGLPSDRVSYPDLLSVSPHRTTDGARLSSDRQRNPQTVAMTTGGMLAMTSPATSPAQPDCDVTSDYSSIEHCEKTGFDNPNYIGGRPISAPERRQEAPLSLPSCCSRDSGISDVRLHQLSPHSQTTSAADSPPEVVADPYSDTTLMTYYPVFMYVIGGREVSQVTRFKRPVSVWRFQFT